MFTARRSIARRRTERARSTALYTLFAAAALAAAACASGTPSDAPTAAVPAATAAPTADPAALDVVRGWLDAQNAGDLERAAAFFAVGARIGPNQLVTTHSSEEVVAALRKTATCHHEIVSLRQDGITVWADVTISGADCQFLQPGESEHGILIPAQVVDGKITCTCPPGTSSEQRTWSTVL